MSLGVPWGGWGGEVLGFAWFQGFGFNSGLLGLSRFKLQSLVFRLC